MARIELRAVPPFLLSGDSNAVRRDAGRLLDSAERQRGRAMEPAAEVRFLASRLAQRRFAAGLLSLPPSSLASWYSCPQCGSGEGVSHGRPGYSYRGRLLPLALSLSRASGWTLLAAVPPGAPETRLGVDIEDPARAGFAGFADLALTRAEQRTIGKLAAGARADAQARLWARKEAWLKMTGDGLRADPSSLDVLDRPGILDLARAETGLPPHLAAAVALSP